MYIPRISKQELLEQLLKHNSALTPATLALIIKMPESYVQRELASLREAGRIP